MSSAAWAIFLLFSPPILAIFARQFSPAWARLRLTWLVVSFWGLSLFPICNLMAIAAVGAIITRPTAEAGAMATWPTNDYDLIMSLIPDGARITHDNRQPRPYKGIDYVMGCGSPIFAPVGGVVTGLGYDGFVGPHGSNNSFLILDTGDFDLIFLHGRYSATVGQAVSRGDLLGHEASIGNSTGCHTDLSVRRRAR